MANPHPGNQNHMFKSLFSEFGVKTEQQLSDKLNKDSETIPCTCCGRETPIDKLRFIEGEPVCKRCNCR